MERLGEEALRKARKGNIVKAVQEINALKDRAEAKTKDANVDYYVQQVLNVVAEQMAKMHEENTDNPVKASPT